MRRQDLLRVAALDHHWQPPPSARDSEPIAPADAAAVRHERRIDTAQLAGFRRSRKKVVIVGAAIALLVVVIVLFATRGGDDTAPTTAVAQTSPLSPPAKPPSAAPSPAASPAAPSPAAPSPAAPSPAAPRSAAIESVTAPSTPPDEAPTTMPALAPGSASSAPATTDSPPPAPANPPAPRKPTIGGKRVVLEYDTPSHDAPAARTTPTAKLDDSPAVTAARRAYYRGNQRLFAGDPEGAIRAYREALASFPGYVAGYRGLGLAYDQTGNKAEAIKALETYARAVPAAKDIALVKKRIARLKQR